MASSYDETCPRDLLQGLSTGTNPLVCADLYTIVQRVRIQQTENTIIHTGLYNSQNLSELYLSGLHFVKKLGTKDAKSSIL